jgi:hypothetical protein
MAARLTDKLTSGEDIIVKIDEAEAEANRRRWTAMLEMPQSN